MEARGKTSYPACADGGKAPPLHSLGRAHALQRARRSTPICACALTPAHSSCAACPAASAPAWATASGADLSADACVFSADEEEARAPSPAGGGWLVFALRTASSPSRAPCCLLLPSRYESQPRVPNTAGVTPHPAPLCRARAGGGKQGRTPAVTVCHGSRCVRAGRPQIHASRTTSPISGLRMNLRCLVRAPEYFWKVVKARKWSGQRGAILECEILRHNSQVWDFDPSFMHEWSEIPIDK